jgi:hypothetical protein
MGGFQLPALVAGILLAVAFKPTLCAQTISNVTGVVTDTSKAVIAGAVVKVVAKDRADTRSAVTDSRGVYKLEALAAGTYRLTVTRQGFATEVVEDLTLSLDRTVALDVVLKVGSTSEQVEVSGSAPLIDTTTPATGMTITPEQIEDIPLNGRNYLDLLQMVPGVTMNNQNDPGTDGAVSILGERGNNTGYMIDGLNNSNQVSGGPSAQFNQDTIAEFEVITSGYKAEFGHASGGIVNVISRTGTNTIHGLASVFQRNNVLDTSDLPGVSTPYLLRWDYDVAGGGALIKNKVFWFSSAERIHENQALNFTIPSATPPVLAASEQAYGGPSRDREVRLFSKVSEILGKHSITEEFGLTNVKTSNFLPLSESTSLPSTRENLGSRSLMIGGTDTVLLRNQDSPFVLNLYAQFRGEPSSTGPAHPQAGPNTLWSVFPSYTDTVFGSLGEVTFGSLTTEGYLQPKYGNTGFGLAKTWKKNTFKFGYDYLRTQVNGVEQQIQHSQLFATAADFATYGPIDSGWFAENFVNGVTPANLEMHLRNNYSGAYFQDDYKLFSSLTVNAGLRWDYDSAFQIKKDFSPRVGFSWAATQETVVRGSYGVFYDHFRLGLARDIPAFGGANLAVGQDFVYPRLFYGIPTSAPALFGLCLSPTLTDAQLAAEQATCPSPAGQKIYGVDHLSNLPGSSAIPANSVVTQSNVQQLSGLDPTTYLNEAAAAIAEPSGYWFWGPNGLLSTLAPSGEGSFPVTLDPSFAVPFTRAATLGVQRQVTRDFVVSFDLYHKGIEQILGVRQTGLPFAARINNNFNGVFVYGYGPWYSGTFNAAILSFEKRYRHHFTVGGSYQYTSEIDDALCSAGVEGTAQLGGCLPTDSYVGETTLLKDPVTGQTNASGGFFASNGNYIPKAGIFWNGPKLDQGPSDFALRHILQLHGMVQIPFKIQLSSVFRLQSGFHYTATAVMPVDQDGNGNYGPRDLKTGRNQFVSPNYGNQDLRISRAFPIHDRFVVQAIFEYFNLFNNANPAAVQVQQSTGNQFGTVTQTLPGRQGEAALRIEF